MLRFSLPRARRSFVVRWLPPLCVVLLALGLHIATLRLDRTLMDEYRTLASRVRYDRTGAVVHASLNSRGQVSIPEYHFPPELVDTVLKKEDAWFYYHPGLNPYRIMVALGARLVGGSSGGASTVTQQLAKTLLNTGRERTLTNKVREAFASLALEYRHSKDELLTMYLNTAPLGGNTQGFPAAARAYYDKRVGDLTESETLSLVAALSNPSVAPPRSPRNAERSDMIARILGASPPLLLAASPSRDTVYPWLELEALEKLPRYRADGADAREQQSSLDAELTERIRVLLKEHLASGTWLRMTHGAVVVIDVRTGELIALVGSPDPESEASGMKISMALERRPIGSTIKPFLYLWGFEKGLRPYSEVEDREYKYGIDMGFALYPKNFDGTYRGTVTLEEALANSLNVPTVVLTRFLTLHDTYRSLNETLGFVPLQAWEEYAYGIALGGFELDLLTLTHAYTALAREGELAPLVIGHAEDDTPIFAVPPSGQALVAHSIGAPASVALVNSILTDRTAGVEQFGLVGPLTLSQKGYAVKTGTSRDYHDSWTVGYTGDFVVGVWVGNSENKPMRAVTGAQGAGSLWADVMELMYTTPYARGTALSMKGLVTVPSSRGVSYGLPGDDIDTARTLLAEEDLILFPHEGDEFAYERGMRVPLTSSESVEWTLNGSRLFPVRDAWYPNAPGLYTLEALTREGRTESVSVRIHADELTLP